MRNYLALFAMTLLAAVRVNADEGVGSKTVIGPSNMYLYDGANALIAGDAEEGVQLTLRGLEFAHGQREVKIAHANLCAGFLLLGQAETALVHCDWVLAVDEYHWRTYNNRALVYLNLNRLVESEADIIRGQELRPRSETLKEVKGMYLDVVKPVEERITIDERRNQPMSPVKGPE